MVRVWWGRFWKLFLFCLFPHHFLKANTNTDIPKVKGVGTISVKSCPEAKLDARSLPVGEGLCPTTLKAVFIM